jgi:hypothetical protein
VVERNELTVELETIRENTMLNFFEMFFPASHKGPDNAALGAAIGAGVSHLICRGSQISIYNKFMKVPMAGVSIFVAGGTIFVSSTPVEHHACF